MSDDHCKEYNCRHRSVKVPPPTDKCQVCGSASLGSIKLKFCSACGERVYCDEQCQKKDWATHKNYCGKTDRIALDTFYPFLAFMAESCHMSRHKPQHFALFHRIINNVNPSAVPIGQPDGWESKLVICDDRAGSRINPADPQNLQVWFAKAESKFAACKLFQRIAREGYALSVLTSICMAILSEMYSTTSAKDANERRVRFKYRSSPIVDFGIAKGYAEVTSVDKLAYLRLSTGEISHGQDPEDHYWMYFTTSKGEEIEIDFAMYTLNMCMMVPLDAYVPSHISYALPFAPVFFRERVIRKRTPPLHKERGRFSALHDQNLQAAIAHAEVGITESDRLYIRDWLKMVAGREPTNEERKFTVENACSLFACLGSTLESRSWEKFPATPPACIDTDPGEMDGASEWEIPTSRAKGIKKKRAARS